MADLSDIKLHSDELLNAALEYARIGFPVFPCAPMSKVPATGHGFKDATRDEAQIRAWWTHCPWFNIGIPTDGFLVLDYDDPNPGNWPKNWPMRDIPEHPFYHCPNDGSHSWLEALPGTDWRNTTKRLAPNIDTRANGGYCVVPPSILPEGEYRWPQGSRKMFKPPRCPEWLATEVTQIQLNGDQTLEKEFLQGDRPIPDGQRNQTLTQIGGWMRRHGFDDETIFSALTVQNAHRCQPPLETDEIWKIAKSVTRYEPDLIAVGAMEGVDLEPTEPHKDQYPDPGPLPDDIVFSIPGLAEEVIEYSLKTAQRMQPVYALAGAIALMSAITGRRIQDHSRTRTNLLCVMIGPTCSGKEWPRQVNRDILGELGWNILGPEEIVSSSGIYTSVKTRPICLLQVDEIGRLFRAIKAATDKAKHLADIPTVLMKLYSQSASIIQGGGYAKGDLNFELKQPHLTLLGTTVMENFVLGLSRDQLSDGFMNRISIFPSELIPDQIDPEIFEIPASILESVSLWRDFYRDRGNLAEENPEPRVIGYSSEATALLQDYRKSCNNRSDREMWGRAYLSTKKYALIYSSSEHGAGIQEVSRPAVEWGVRLVEYQITKTLYLADQNMADSAFEADQLELARWVRARGKVTLQQLRKSKFRKWQKKYRDEVLEEIREQGKVGLRKDNSAHLLKHRPSKTGPPATEIYWRGE